MKPENLNAYKLSMKMGEKVWGFVNEWDYFSKVTIGKQLVRATDSIACNLSESCGVEKGITAKDMAYYSKGYLNKTKTLVTKAALRKLINEKEFQNISEKINEIDIELSNYIKTLNKEKFTEQLFD